MSVSVRSAFVVLVLIAGLFYGPGSVFAQTPAPPPPEKVDRLLELLSDPEVKAWLAAQGGNKTAPPATTTATTGDGTMMVAPSDLTSALDTTRGRIDEMVKAVPLVPAQFEQAVGKLRAEIRDKGTPGILILVIGFAAVGFGVDWVARRLLSAYRQWMISLPPDTPHDRVKALGSRLLYSAIMVGAFVAGSVGVFLAFNWPPRLREVVLGYLLVVIVTWATLTVSRAFLLPPSLGVPHSTKMRAFPMTDERAGHWHKWIAINVFWVTFVAVTFALLNSLGFDRVSRTVLSVPTSSIQLVLLLLAVWLRPKLPSQIDSKAERIRALGWSWMLSLYFIAIWAINIAGARRFFWFVVAAAALPAALVLVHRGVHYVLRPPEPETGAKPIAPVMLAVADRGIRVVLIIAAALLLARAWGLDMESMAGDNMTNRLLRGGLKAAIIVLAADFGWSIIKAIIARRLGDMPSEAAGNPQNARLRTLLPIFQNILLATLIVITGLMVLSSMGIQIGPLIAGAGVVGVAVGFGAQTVVKDVISGVFYLLDDAFRVGEYIQSGTYKGTVESFSLRSVKLRHHRGPVYTVPFGELGAVQNMSRDWVMEKFSINVDYDTDIEKARKIIKKIGQQFAEDPEFAADIIEPLKMQGVENFGDYGIELRLKLMTKPGHQFTVKRKAYVAIKQAFAENGIKISTPTVHVQEGAGAGAAAAHHAVQKAAKEATAAAAGKA
ncbi:MAG: mechanosensitive ion channel family protein [Mesorhizobium sp.]